MVARPPIRAFVALSIFLLGSCASKLPKNATNVTICNDYGSSFNCSGTPYRINNPVRGPVYRHEGIDFAQAPGTPVISATHGVVADAGYYRCGGGILSVATEIEDVNPETGKKERLTARYIHIRLTGGVRVGDPVKPGDVIGSVAHYSEVKECIDRVSHLHYELIFQYYPHKIHVDPHKYWLDGPGKATCYSASLAVPKDKAVLPIPCEFAGSD